MHQQFFNYINELAKNSPDPTRKVGAILVKDNKIISEGFNDFVNISNKKPEFLEKPLKYFYLEHAERNAIFNAIKNNINISDSILYVNWFPCSDCVRSIIACGIKEIITPPKPTGRTLQASFDAAENMLNNSNIKITIYEDK